MLISTKGRYALRVMVDLAEHQSEGFIPLKVIAERQEISEKYLESIIKLLVKAKLLNGVRGKGGGYRLILQCQSKTPTLRRYLSETGWAICEETVLRDGRFLYTVMEVLWQP